MAGPCYIAIPTRERRAIVAECVPTVKAGMTLGDILIIYDDCSHEYGYKFLEKWASVAHREPVAIGIEAQRRNHFRAFWATGMPYLYLTDSDALHDPSWRGEAMRLQARADGAPVCLYNTTAHVSIQGNTIDDDLESDIIWRRVAPGISYWLTREHVAKIMPFVDQLQHWDWQVPEILGHRFAVARRSYVDHIGFGGMHHPSREGFDGGDRALNPSVPLVRLRRQAVARLKECYATRDNYTEHANAR